ncbi:NUDIX hydrolase [Actinacidiphila sp. ITFR-21]|uniref:NUDIX hydrolase n=1 Tax=Actinacidiphila sp. ITFR-21 TaxID=3075199 RepID=UPI00288A8846|nr:NUDIX hydrolase [Streptomyces sp. ITFR-21]WNI18057.1 NUDIX hydrolase [Streptomyces sp. ITFR-21]
MPLYKPPLWPVSVKAVVFDAQRRVLLLENERREWGLPGGRLEITGQETGEAADLSPEAAVEREVLEETGWKVTAGPLIEGGLWIYEPIPGRRVLIVTYGCTALDPAQEPVASSEHKRIGLFPVGELGALTVPGGYRDAIRAWYGRT